MIFAALMLIGWFTLKASVYSSDLSTFSYFDFGSPMGKHTAWVVVAMAVMVVTLVVDWQLWSYFAYPIYAITIVMLLLVLLLGTEIKGATSWFTLGSVSIQPSEFAKFGTCLAISSYLSHYSVDLRKRQAILTTAMILGVPMLLIMLQPDAGSALVFTSFLILLYIKGLSPDFYIYIFVLTSILILSLMIGPELVMCGAVLGAFLLLLSKQAESRTVVIAGLVGLIVWYAAYQQGYNIYVFMAYLVIAVAMGIRLFVMREQRLATLVLTGIVLCGFVAYGSSMLFNNVLQPHQQDRINVWLRPDKCDPQGSLYNVLQSKLAIGAGGFAGKGHLNGTMTKLNYVPEQSTDFIFSIVGEEQGFLGSLVVIGLFVMLLIRIVSIAERGKTPFVRCYGYGVAGIFFVHFAVNIGMSVGLMPIIGIPLPFLSKGGSAMIAFTLMLGVLLRMDLSRHRA
jgi:rod shape determining protein RodA